MNEKIENYKKALELVKSLGQSILADSNYLSDEVFEPIADIDILIHYFLKMIDNQ
jgi:hypothetical protein